jgi:WD40 repeat protein
MKNICISKQAELSGHAGPVYCLLKLRQNNLLLSGSADKMIGSWNIDSYTPNNFSVKTNASVFSLCHIHPLNYLCVGLSNGSLHIIDLNQKKEIKNIVHYKAPVFNILYNSHKRHLYSASGDGILSIWDTDTFKLLLNIPMGIFKIRQLSLHHNHLAVACGDGNIRILETEFYNEIYKLNAHQDSVHSIKYNEANNLLVSGGKDAHLKFWDVGNHYKLIKSIPAHNYAIYAIDFNSDQSLMITGSRDKTIKLWNIHNYEIIKRIDRKNFQAHTHSVNAVLWINQQIFVSSGDDKKIIFWKVDVT